MRSVLVWYTLTWGGPASTHVGASCAVQPQTQ